MPGERTILIVGASTRAAAYSARRAGWSPACADLFGDADLPRAAELIPVTEYPASLARDVASASPSCWMYTGALENRPETVEQISRERRLLGNPPDVLRAVRDPLQIASLLRSRGLPALEVCTAGHLPEVDARWMVKPLKSAGGRLIRVWDEAAVQSRVVAEPHYFQQRAFGKPISALFLGVPKRGVLVGIARQLAGACSDPAEGFAYCGSIAPLEVPERVVASIARIGDVIAAQMGLRGLFGCDFVLENGTPWLTEVNPRYTASVELFEHAYRQPLLAWHIEACETFETGRGGDALARRAESIRVQGMARIVGKRILYAGRQMTAPSFERFLPSGDLVAIPFAADLPREGTRIDAGSPVCTVFATALNEAVCEARLKRRAARLGRWLDRANALDCV